MNLEDRTNAIPVEIRRRCHLCTGQPGYRNAVIVCTRTDQWTSTNHTV